MLRCDPSTAPTSFKNHSKTMQTRKPANPILISLSKTLEDAPKDSKSVVMNRSENQYRNDTTDLYDISKTSESLQTVKQNKTDT